MISTIFWILRGIANAPAFTRLKKLIHMYRVPSVALMEPVVEVN